MLLMNHGGCKSIAQCLVENPQSARRLLGVGESSTSILGNGRDAAEVAKVANVFNTAILMNANVSNGEAEMRTEGAKVGWGRGKENRPDLESGSVQRGASGGEESCGDREVFGGVTDEFDREGATEIKELEDAVQMFLESNEHTGRHLETCAKHLETCAKQGWVLLLENRNAEDARVTLALERAEGSWRREVEALRLELEAVKANLVAAETAATEAQEALKVQSVAAAMLPVAEVTEAQVEGTRGRNRLREVGIVEG